MFQKCLDMELNKLLSTIFNAFLELLLVSLFRFEAIKSVFELLFYLTLVCLTSKTFGLRCERYTLLLLY